MKYAIIQTGGKQYKVSEGDVLEVEHLPNKKDQKVTFSEVLLYTNDGAIKLGNPFINGVTVEGVVLDHVKGDKIRVAKFKAKSRYRRVTGHRQSLSKVKIDLISEAKSAKKAEETKTEKK